VSTAAVNGNGGHDRAGLASALRNGAESLDARSTLINTAGEAESIDELLEESRQIVDRLSGALGHHPATPERLRRLDVPRLVREEPPDVPWVVNGLVAAGMLTVLNGREGEGKSLLAMALTAGVANGADEAGMSCQLGSALIVDAENGEHEIHRRVKTLELPAYGVEVFEAQGFDLRRGLAELDDILATHRPDLLVLDSFRSLWNGEENDSREVSGVLDPLRNLVRHYGVGTLLLHHSGKVGGAYRGSSAIGASAELGFRLARHENDPDPARCFVETWKCRPAQRPPRRWLRLSVERGQVFIDAAPPFEQDPKPHTDSPRSRELAPRLVEAVTVSALSLADAARAIGEEPKNRTVRRVLDALQREGAIVRGEDGLYRVSGVTTPIEARHHDTPGVRGVAECRDTLDTLTGPEEGTAA